MGAAARHPFKMLKKLVDRTAEACHPGHCAPGCGDPGEMHCIGENVGMLVGGLAAALNPPGALPLDPG